MEQVERMDSIKQYNEYIGVDTLHPLVSVVNFDDMEPIQHFKRLMGVYAETRFENLLNDYFKSCKPYDLGLPTVTYCAEELYLSPNYFGDLIKKETGNTALDYIQAKLIDEAKTKMFDASKTINDIAAELGFKCQQHFTRLFKQKTGVTPNEYRGLN